jgi:hypothetical protein
MKEKAENDEIFDEAEDSCVLSMCFIPSMKVTKREMT